MEVRNEIKAIIHKFYRGNMTGLSTIGERLEMFMRAFMDMKQDIQTFGVEFTLIEHVTWEIFNHDKLVG